MIYKKIDELVEYGIRTGLIKDADKIFVRNRLLTKLGLDEYKESDCEDVSETLEEILDSICDYAAENGMLESNSIVYRDIFDTEIIIMFFSLNFVARCAINFAIFNILQI